MVKACISQKCNYVDITGETYVSIIGASLSEPHTNHCYEKIAVLMYVCMYVAIRRPRVYSACAYV